MQRRVLKTEDEVAPKRRVREPTLEFINTGCVLLDCVTGWGWPVGRMSNIIGDKSTGKTLLAIEAAANFARKWPEGHIYYREAEAAFDETYAETLGLPPDRVDFGPDGLGSLWETVEDIYNDLGKVIKRGIETGQPSLYIIDSLDALSSRAELAREIDEGSYGMEKQKQLGQLFRRQIQGIGKARIALLIISQVRDKIGVTFGDKHRRAGGRAMDFYASIVVYMSHMGQVHKTINKIKRTTGVEVKVKCTKNKIHWPFRDCQFSIRFGYGIDELLASLEWLEEAGAAKPILEGAKIAAFVAEAEQLDDREYRRLVRDVRKAVRATWAGIDDKFAPTRRKY